MTRPGDPLDDLAGALRELRAAVGEWERSHAASASDTERAAARTLLTRIDDYALPRLTRLDAPMLVGVGGPSGSGKSTLVNSLIRAPATPAGVLRPTTRTPVLVCDPADAAWFRGGDLLSGLRRTSGTDVQDQNRLRLVSAPGLTAGCAFLDTPDIDSVVAPNRETAVRLLGAVDLWLFVTTATRYADAVGWELLRAARQRAVAVALVLNRCPRDRVDEITGHLDQLLRSHELVGVPMFVLPETTVDGHGLLPERDVSALRQWFDGLAGDAAARSRVVRQTLDGTIATFPPVVERLADHLDTQTDAAERLAEDVGIAFGTGRAAAERAIESGAVVTGEVRARWVVFAADRPWLRGSPLTRLRRWWRAVASDRPPAGHQLLTALEAGLAAVVRAAVVDGSERAHRAWLAHAATAPLFASQVDALAVPATTAQRLGGVEDQVTRALRQWRLGLREQVRQLLRAPTPADHATGGDPGADDAPARRRRPRWFATGRLARDPVAVTALVAVAAVATEPSTDPARGPADTGLLAAMPSLLARPPLSGLVDAAREALRERIGMLLDTEATRFLKRLAEVTPPAGAAARLRETAAALERTRAAADLSGPPAEPDKDTADRSGPGPDGAAADAGRTAAGPDGRPPADPRAGQARRRTGARPARAVPRQAGGPDNHERPPAGDGDTRRSGADGEATPRVPAEAAEAGR